MQTGQIFKIATLHNHDNYYDNNDDNDEEGSARETRRFQSGEFQERDRDIRAEEQTLFSFSLCGVSMLFKSTTFHFLVFHCIQNAPFFTLWCFGAFEISLRHRFANKLHEVFYKSR